MNEPEDILKLRVFGFPEHAGHVMAGVDYKNLTSIQLAYIFGICTLISEEINKELEERFDADRAYLLTELGKISVAEFNKKVAEEKAKLETENSKGNRLKKAFDIFKKYNKEDDSEA